MSVEILVVDDVREVCDLVAALVPRLGIEAHVRSETDGIRARELLATTPFDLVIADLDLKTTSGVDLLTVAHATHPQGRRLLITAHEQLSAPLRRLEAASVDAYMQKPFGGAEMMLLLRDLLKGDPETLRGLHAESREIEARGSIVFDR